MIDPKAKPIGNRNPYPPIDVSGRKPVPPDDKAKLGWLNPDEKRFTRFTRGD